MHGLVEAYRKSVFYIFKINIFIFLATCLLNPLTRFHGGITVFILHGSQYRNDKVCFLREVRRINEKNKWMVYSVWRECGKNSSF